VNLVHRSSSVSQTEAIAAEFAAQLQGGECIALQGVLGAGKTQFTRGLVQGLGGDGRMVSSPTFVLLNVYPTPRFSVFHIDAYRASGPDELESIGFTELLGQRGVVIVEWAERIASIMPRPHRSVRITAVGKQSRKIEIDTVR
jgi:tRNA threonylcarbamoyl adenosine modification protein YjeE